MLAWPSQAWVESETKLKEICEAGEPLGLLFPIKLSGPDAESIDAAILRAIVNKQRSATHSHPMNALPPPPHIMSARSCACWVLSGS